MGCSSKRWDFKGPIKKKIEGRAQDQPWINNNEMTMAWTCKNSVRNAKHIIKWDWWNKHAADNEKGS